MPGLTELKAACGHFGNPCPSASAPRQSGRTERLDSIQLVKHSGMCEAAIEAHAKARAGKKVADEQDHNRQAQIPIAPVVAVTLHCSTFVI